MQPEFETFAEPTPGLELVSEQSELTQRLHRNLSEFSRDVISYRTEDLERFGRPGATSVYIWAPRTFGGAVLRVIEPTDTIGE